MDAQSNAEIKHGAASDDPVSMAVAYTLSDPAGAAALAEWWAECVPRSVKDAILSFKTSRASSQ